MKSGDRFFTKGNWNTEEGWWEVISPEPDYGRVWCKPIDHPSEGDSWWSELYVKRQMEERDARAGE